MLSYAVHYIVLYCTALHSVVVANKTQIRIDPSDNGI